MLEYGDMRGLIAVRPPAPDSKLRNRHCDLLLPSLWRITLNVDMRFASALEGIAIDRPFERRDLRSAHWIEGTVSDYHLTPAISSRLKIRGKQLSIWSRSHIKRLFDCACIVPLVPLLLPVCLVIALAVRLTSPGPVFFLQKRMGRYGRTFTIVKFRTMIHSTDIAHQLITTESNQRFTPIGPLLRRWKLDELPQLMNVLWGDMSLVGPRPKIREHRISVLPCRPGITGAATIAFADEEFVLDRISRHKLDSWYQSVALPAKRNLDSEYMARATFLSDLRLIVKSILRRWDSYVIEDLVSEKSLETDLGMGRFEATASAPALSPCFQPDYLQINTAERNAEARRPSALSAGASIRLAILGTRGIPARYGGFETFAEQLATSLAQRGVNVTVFCPASSPIPDLTYLGATLRYVKSPRLGSFSETVWDVQCLWRARREFDVVYMLGVGAGFAAWIPRLYGAKVWINSDGVEWKRRKWTWPQRAYLAAAEAMSVLFATKIIADADSIAEYLRKRYPGLKKLSTIAYGADIPVQEPRKELLDKWGLKPGSYYLVVCRLEPENHILEIVEGFQRSKSRKQLVILGDIGNGNSYVKELLRHKSDQIRFLGAVYDRAALSALRSYACAYLHGHSVGGTNPSLLEAMACSNLVIAHDNPFNREVLGDCGLYWSTREEVASMVDAVDESRVSASQRRKMAAEIVRTRYTWNKIAGSYLAALQEARNAAVVTRPIGEQYEVAVSGPRVTQEP